MSNTVYLVGAGCGDKNLITIKAQNLIEKADIIIYDYLARVPFKADCKPECELIYVGKQANNHTLSQDEISELIIEKSKQYKTVVRLKGGDPYVFGRGGEEALFLKQNGINFEVVPAVTSGIGGICYAGIPATHRGVAGSVHLITGHRKSSDDEINYKALSMLDGTFVFYMGLGEIDNITKKLIENGKNPKTPVAVVKDASLPTMEKVISTLDKISQVVKQKDIKPPALIVVGDVVNFSNDLDFYSSKPLFGKNVIVTRARNQNSEFLSKITDELGANAIEFPTIKTIKTNPNSWNNVFDNINDFNYIILTSQNGVDAFFNGLFEKNIDARNLTHIKFCVVGHQTAKTLKQYGIIADIIPKSQISTGLIEILKDILIKTDKVLLPRVKNAKQYLSNALKEICDLTEVVTYETVADDSDKTDILAMLKNNEIDYITFTSGSTVENFVNSIEQQNINLLKNVKILSIGEQTSKQIKRFNLNEFAQADKPSIDEMIKLLKRCEQND